MEFLTAWFIQYGMITASSTIATFIMGWFLKKIPSDKFAKWAKKIGKSQGLAVTTFFNTKLPKLWNAVIEPIFIDTIDAVFLGWIRGFIDGLKSDNE